MAPEAPLDLWDQEQICAIAWRCDRTTRNQAKRRLADDFELPYERIRMRKTYVRWDQDYVDELVADGAEEPYDGWSAWIECKPGQDGIAYWTSGNWDEPELYEREAAHD